MRNGVFISTHWNRATRRLLINSERILTLERLEKDGVVTYLLLFDSLHEVELDEGTGEALEFQLGQIDRPRPPTQYVTSDARPRLPRRMRTLRGFTPLDENRDVIR